MPTTNFIPIDILEITTLVIAKPMNVGIPHLITLMINTPHRPHPMVTDVIPITTITITMAVVAVEATAEAAIEADTILLPFTFQICSMEVFNRWPF